MSNEKIYNLINDIKVKYEERDLSNIKSFIKNNFHEDSLPIIIGTGVCEWCFGLEETEKLFISDWKNWGNVAIDLDSIIIESNDQMAWFYTDASVVFTYYENDDVYKYFYDNIKEIIKENKPYLSRASEIIYKLSLLLHSRDIGVRKYRNSLCISGILIKIENEWKISRLNFSLPDNEKIIGFRLEHYKNSKNDFEKISNKIKIYNNNCSGKRNPTLINKVMNLFNENFNEVFINDHKKRYFTIDGCKLDGQEYKIYLQFFNGNNQEVIISKDDIIVESYNNNFSFCTLGILNKQLILDNEIEKIFSLVDEDYNSSDIKSNLFKIRRDLSYVIKEASLSSSCNIIFRMQGTGTFTNDSIKINYMHISHPHIYTIEGQNDYQTRL